MWVIAGSLVAFWIAGSVLALALCVSAGRSTPGDEAEGFDRWPADLGPQTVAGDGVVGGDAPWSGAALHAGDALP